MKYFRLIRLIWSILWLITNILLILTILIRDNDERSLQETFSNLLILDNFYEMKNNLDNLIWILIFCYFLLGVSYNKLFV
jgi:hypothetical protein